MRSLTLAIVLVFGTLAACSDEPRRVPDTVARKPPPPPPPPQFGGGATAYRTIDLSSGVGRIAGEIRFEGQAPRDTTVRPTSDPTVCGVEFVDTSFRTSRGLLSDVVVWLVDARTGKALPLDRRFEITHRRCRLEPRVQAVRVGGTLNIRSVDRTVHQARFIREVDGGTLAVVTEHDAGQVVPDETVLQAAGRIEIRCDVHPWTHGWILAFDHPYYDVTDRRGMFAMDSVPPGRYRVIAWHERLGEMQDSVTVTAGATTRLDLTMRPR